jgi:hypothetical protein
MPTHEGAFATVLNVLVRHPYRTVMRGARPMTVVPIPSMVAPGPPAPDPDISRAGRNGLHFHEGRRRSHIHGNPRGSLDDRTTRLTVYFPLRINTTREQ